LISAKSDSNNEAVSIVVGGENLICTLRSWLSRWSIEDSRADATRCAKQISVPFLAIENSADDGAPASHMHVSLRLIIILCGQLHRPNVFQDAPKIRLRREAHGSRIGRVPRAMAGCEAF
jgi:hypothetical protein